MINNARKIPLHVAIIMDGNGRWAKQRGLPRGVGHAAGAKTLKNVIRWCANRNIRYVSFYAFSTENWKRPVEEVSAIMGLLKRYLMKEVDELRKEDGRLRFCGRKDNLPDDIIELMAEAEEKTKDGRKIDVIICFNYGGRAEILDAINRILSDNLTPPITEEIFRRYLYLPDVPDPDLVIRTSGELRLSNFLVWQTVYSELYFTDVLWPDFDEKELDRAIEDFSKRKRRFGGVDSV